MPDSSVTGAAVRPLDPYKNISTERGDGEGFTRGHYHRQYLGAAQEDGWGRKGTKCGSRTLVHENADGTLKIVPALCGMFSCRLCGPMRAAWLKGQIGQALTRDGLDTFVTLTLRAGGARTWQQSYMDITASYNRFRTYQAREHGPFRYVWTVEPTKQKYAHMHLLGGGSISGTSPSTLAGLWRRSTGDSYVVDAEPVNTARAGDYIAKYTAKQAALRSDPAWAFLTGKRLFSKSRSVQFEPFKVQGDGTWQMWERPYWEAHDKLAAAAPIVDRRVTGRPYLVVQASGLVAGVPSVVGVL